jgi:signal transduction histidine kinase
VEKFIRLSVAAEAKCVVFSVQDKGMGMGKETLRRVGEKFFREAHDRAGQARSGFGLGLSIVRAIVAAHGGSLTFESKENAGTTCHLRLPISNTP